MPEVRATFLRMFAVAVTALGCGDDGDGRIDAAVPDGSARDAGAVPDGAGDVDGSVVVPAGDRVALFGPEPSFYEQWSSNDEGAPVRRFHLGSWRTGFSWPLPLAGDFDGDGIDTVAFYDVRAGQVHLLDETTGEERVIDLGGVTRLPLCGDWDGDGDDTLGLYDPATGSAELREDPSTPGRTVAGPPAQYPLAADLDGDGIDELAFYDGATFVALEPVPVSATIGPADAFPFAGDFDGDGRDGVGLFDVAAETFHLWNVIEERPADMIVRAPTANWVRWPLAGRWPASPPRPASTGFAWDAVAPASVGIDASGLAAAESALDAMPSSRSFLVMKRGALAHEAYFHGNGPEIAHNIKSVSKSVLGTVLAMTVANGTVPDEPIATLLPAVSGDGDPRRAAIGLDHLLTMTTGLSWNEDRIDLWFETDDWVRAAWAAPMVSDPGTAFLYSTGNTHIASAIITWSASRPTDEVARELLLEPLGIVAERWDRDPQGIPVGGAEVTMRPRDLARFGQLFLEDGRPSGTPIVNAALIEGLRTEAVPASWIDGDLRYALWWWVRTFGSTDAYFAWGYGGQFVFVFPTLEAVVVITSRSDVDGATAGEVAYGIFEVITTHVVPALGG